MLPTRLVTRLLLSYALLALILVAALSFCVSGLVRVNDLVNSLRREEIAALEAEQRVHRAAWELEVAARWAVVVCEQPNPDPVAVIARLRTARERLEESLATHAGLVREDVLASARGYRDYALEIERSPTCAEVLSIPLRKARFALDEKLTYAWNDRMGELRLAIVRKEDEARRIATTSITNALVVGLAGLALVGALAIVFSVNVSRAFARLAAQARRVGEGDFRPLPPTAGTAEMRELSLELDRMRARLAELDQLKVAFVASVSHDLRTPLTRVREALGLLADRVAGPLTERQERVVTLARAACEREIRLVASLLDLSRVRSGQPLRRDTGTSIDRIIDVVCTDLAEEASERKVTFVHERHGLPSATALDAALVERAVANLVSNALSVSKAGQRIFIVRDETPTGPPAGEARSARWLRVIVRDEGPGVPLAVRDRLFLPFVTHEVGAGRQGTGLGLSLAREMIRAHGGDVLLLSGEGPGAAFAIWIPIDGGPASAEELA